MNKKTFFPFVSLLILLLLFSGCNKDDTSNNPDPDPDPVNNIPGNFDITISDITSNSATVNWTVPTTDEPTTIVYSVYLNESLLAENLSDNSYGITDLDGATNYSVKVKAINEFGKNESINNFTTEAIANLRLKTFDDLTFKYNQYNQLIWKSWDYEYTYNENNDILTEKSSLDNPFRYYLEYTYDDNVLSELLIRENNYDSFKTNYYFESPTKYNYTYEVYIDYNTYIYNYQVEITLNNQGEVIQYEKEDLDTSVMEIISFEYENGNLTKMMINGGDVVEILYDSAKNWHTYKSRYPGNHDLNPLKESAGLIFLYGIPDYGSQRLPLYDKLKDIPHFYDHVNVNNPVEFKLNGETHLTFEYEYNNLDYPVTIKANFSSGYSETVELGYEEVP